MNQPLKVFFFKLLRFLLEKISRIYAYVVVSKLDYKIYENFIFEVILYVSTFVILFLQNSWRKTGYIEMELPIF